MSGAASATVAPPHMMQPALLTIPDDNFMAALSASLAADPGSLISDLAVGKSYRVRPPGKSDDWEPPGTIPPLKLYQPAHGHFNLVASSLICQLPGLPEHGVHPELKESVSFVVRRHDAGSEWAWVPAATGGQWESIPPQATGQAVAGEKQMPLFPVHYTTEGLARTLFVGLVPTTSIETFKTAATATSPSGSTLPGTTTDLLAMAFETRVSAPLAQMITSGIPADARVPGGALLVLDFASFLHDWFPTSFNAVVSGDAAAPSAQPVFDLLATAIAGTTVATQPDGSLERGPRYGSQINWLSAVIAAWEQAEWLSGESATVPSNPLALDLAQPGQRVSSPPVPDICIQLQAAVAASSPEGESASGASVPGTALATAPKLDPSSPQEYLIRCVYDRPECLLVSATVSAPTADFQIASFYDFDAPARPVTISLPLITGLADLRKFRKNVNFLVSRELHAQMDRIIDLKNTMNGTLNPPAGGDGLGVNWICSFSIPIVTICAMFVLIMFVIMLNLVFFWLPFFEICLPVPKK
jgi:hypothetical protein